MAQAVGRAYWDRLASATARFAAVLRAGVGAKVGAKVGARNDRRVPRFGSIEIAQIFLAYLRVLLDLFRRANRQHLAFKDDIATVNRAENLARGMVRDQNTDSVVAQLTDDALNRLHGDRVDAGKRLIEHDDPRIRYQAPGNLEPSALNDILTIVVAPSSASLVMGGSTSSRVAAS